MQHCVIAVTSRFLSEKVSCAERREFKCTEQLQTRLRKHNSKRSFIPTWWNSHLMGGWGLGRRQVTPQFLKLAPQGQFYRHHFIKTQQVHVSLRTLALGCVLGWENVPSKPGISLFPFSPFLLLCGSI